MPGWTKNIEQGNKNTPWLPNGLGRLYSSPNINVTATLVVAINKLYAIPIIVNEAATAVSLNIELTVQSSGNNARLGIYYDNNGKPGNLLLDAGLVSETGTGNKPITISVNLPAGWYWLALASSGTPTVRANSQSNAFPMLGYASGADLTTHIGWEVNFSYGTGVALPNPFTAGGALASGSMPRLLIGF